MADEDNGYFRRYEKRKRFVMEILGSHFAFSLFSPRLTLAEICSFNYRVL